MTADQFNATFSINLVDQSQSDVIAEAFSGQNGVEAVTISCNTSNPCSRR